MVELTSIARGIETSDDMIKAAQVNCFVVQQYVLENIWSSLGAKLVQ